MRPSEFSDEEVIKAGTHLEEAGRRVTGFAIRKEIGGGNATRLKNIWDTHKQSQKVVEAEPVQELPVEVQDALEKVTGDFVEQFKSLVISLNNKAVKTAERRVSEVINAAKNEQDKAEAELSDAEIAVEELENQVEEMKNEIKIIEEEHLALQNKFNEKEKEFAVLNEKTDSLTNQLKQKDETISLCEKQASQAETTHLETKRQVDKLQNELIKIASKAAGKTD